MTAAGRTQRPFTGVVAMDGPSGTGKSTVARRLAIELGARYLDTGAMYRAATLAVIRAGVGLEVPEAIADVATSRHIDISTDPRHPAITLDGGSVDAEIRSASVTGAVSAVSAVPAVREWLVAAQRALIGSGAIVVEGRDIGTVVWPAAAPKIYLTASAATRAQRRAGELGAVDVAAVADDIERRDRLDSGRAASPLVRAADAIDVDTTTLSVDDVVKRLVDIVRSSDSDE
ncbi:MAG TPA: (d)CMP kinase [Jatrophihabitantaceae bacterium]|jgi:cytidylate kinase|nr:(d)CMP kinase [Jatrophihabitantaceae bacterium]